MKATRNFLILACVVVALGTTSNVRADFTFGKPVPVGSGLTPFDYVTCLSYDGLEMYIQSARTNPEGTGRAVGNYDLWVLRRASKDEAWGPLQNLGPAINSPSNEFFASISADGLTLYFDSDRPYGDGGHDNIYMTTRPTRNDPWGPAVKMGPEINGPGNVSGSPWVSGDGLEFYFESWRSGIYGGIDMYVASRATANDAWGNAVNLGSVVNSTYAEEFPSLSPDGLLLLFSDEWSATLPPRPGGYGSSDLWMTRRASLSDPWQPPVNLGPKVNSPAINAAPRISPDGRTLYFISGGQPWQAPVIPIVDFNGDEIVDINDLVMLIESWGKDDPSVDIGPMPWGDGKVDANDLEVLMSYWQREVLPGSLIAYWKLDEAEGSLAFDSVGTGDGVLVGDPLWQPTGGKLGGALQLDGVDDCVTTEFVRDPSEGPFSVFAWVKGGAPGQVILSQEKGADWLMADATGGTLTTQLRYMGRFAGAPLTSQAVIVNGDWHRVGFVWDGSNRILYADGAEVGRDTQTGLPVSIGGLTIGAGSTLAPGSFWSGLIDDVRIYDRVVKP